MVQELGVEEIYEKFGGYDLIEEVKGYVHENNFEGYLNDLHKYNAFLKLMDSNIGVDVEFYKKINLHSLDAIYKYYVQKINTVFVDVEYNLQTYNMFNNWRGMFDKANEGKAFGLPLTDAPLLTKEIGGCPIGNVFGYGALSGVGKSTSTLKMLVTSSIEFNQKMVIFINEEDAEKWQQQMATWIINNKFNGNFDKKRFINGHFTTDEMNWIDQAVEYSEELSKQKIITIIPLQSYNVDLVIRLINKYSAMGINNFVLDTFKESNDATGELWQSMAKDMTKLYDTVKPASKNVFLWVTFQLSKAMVSRRYLSMDSIGKAKNILDVMSVCLLSRKVRSDEMPNGSNPISVYMKYEDKRIPIPLDQNKKYMIIFIAKNRNGNSDLQLVYEIDLGKNTMKEIGYTDISEDF